MAMPSAWRVNKERYFQLYDAMKKNWPIESESRMVDTSYGKAFFAGERSARSSSTCAVPGSNFDCVPFFISHFTPLLNEMLKP
jgi:hypothetical protein